MFRSLQLILRLCCLVLAFSLFVPGHSAPAVQADAPGYHWVATWGLPAEPGTLNRPTSLDVDSAGNVYLVDAGLGNVQVFSPAGTFLRQFGQLGRPVGEMLDPVDIAVRGERIYLADYGNARTQVLTSAGEFLLQIDGTQVAGGGWDKRRPAAVEADAQGRFFILSREDGQVRRYAPDGTLEFTYTAQYPNADFAALAVLSTGVHFYATGYRLSRVELDGTSQLIGQDGGQPDDLSSIHALAAAPDDSVWAYNLEQRQLSHLSPTGARLGSFTVDAPVLKMAAAAERLYLLLYDDTIAVYDWGGTRLATWEKPAFTAAGSFDHPDRLAVAPDGSLYVLERARGRIQQLDANGNVLAMFGTGLAAQGNLNNPQALTTDGLGRLYVADALDDADNGGRIVRFVNGRFDMTYHNGSLSLPPEGPFTPVGLVTFGDTLVQLHISGPLYYTALAGWRIREAPGPWARHVALAITPSGQTYALHNERYKSPVVEVRAFDGAHVGSWGQLAGVSAAGDFVQPTSIAADLRGHIFVLDATYEAFAYPTYFPVDGSQVQVFDEVGNFLTQWGGFGHDPGQFIRPQAVVALADGRIVVADTDNNRLQVFAPNEALPPFTPLPGITADGPEVQPLFVSWVDQGPINDSINTPRALVFPPNVTPASPIIAMYGSYQVAGSMDGTHWQRVNRLSPATLFVRFYAGSRTLIAEDSLRAVYRSDDGARTWTRLGDAIATNLGPDVYRAASPTFDTDGILFASIDHSGFWRSADRGNTWQLRSLDDMWAEEFAVAADADGQRTLLLYGGGRTFSTYVSWPSALLRSTDDGATWEPVAPGSAPAWLGFSPAFAADHTAFYIGGDRGAYTLYRSTDAGRTWSVLSALPLTEYEYVQGVTFSPGYAADQTLMVWGTTSIYISTNAGGHWQPLSRAAAATPPSVVAFSPTYSQTHAIWVADDRFQQTTDYGATWQPMGSSFPDNVWVYNLAGAEAAEAAPPWAISDAGLFAADASGDNWERITTFDKPLTGRILARSPAFTQDHTAMAYAAITHDGGATWQALPFPDTYSGFVSRVGGFAPDYATSKFKMIAWRLYGGPTGIKFSAVDEEWQNSATPPDKLTPLTLAFDARWPATPNIYLGGEGGVYKSTDRGQTWAAAGLEAQAVRGLVSRLEGSQHVLYAATRTVGVWRSLDDGATWTAWNDGLPNGNACAMSRSATGLAVGLCDGRAYLWSAALNAWQRVGTRLPAGVNALLLDGDWPGGTLWAGTSDGIYRASLVEGPVYTIRLPMILRR